VQPRRSIPLDMAPLTDFQETEEDFDEGIDIKFSPFNSNLNLLSDFGSDLGAIDLSHGLLAKLESKKAEQWVEVNFEETQLLGNTVSLIILI
jgi:hypothetical protein